MKKFKQCVEQIGLDGDGFVIGICMSIIGLFVGFLIVEIIC